MGVWPIPPHLGYSGRATAALRPACNLPASRSPLPAPSLQLHEDTASSVPGAVRIQHHPQYFQITPAEARDNMSYFFFTQQRRCLPNSGFTEPPQLPPRPFLQPPAHSPCTCSPFHNRAEFISGLRSLAIINHTLSIPPRLHCTHTFPASRLLSGLSSFGTTRPRTSLEHSASESARRSCCAYNPISQPKQYHWTPRKQLPAQNAALERPEEELRLPTALPDRFGLQTVSLPLTTPGFQGKAEPFPCRDIAGGRVRRCP